MKGTRKKFKDVKFFMHGDSCIVLCDSSINSSVELKKLNGINVPHHSLFSIKKTQD